LFHAVFELGLVRMNTRVTIVSG